MVTARLQAEPALAEPDLLLELPCAETGTVLL
jgi:hypothetical protein